MNLRCGEATNTFQRFGITCCKRFEIPSGIYCSQSRFQYNRPIPKVCDFFKASNKLSVLKSLDVFRIQIWNLLKLLMAEDCLSITISMESAESFYEKLVPRKIKSHTLKYLPHSIINPFQHFLNQKYTNITQMMEKTKDSWHPYCMEQKTHEKKRIYVKRFWTTISLENEKFSRVFVLSLQNLVAKMFFSIFEPLMSFSLLIN